MLRLDIKREDWSNGAAVWLSNACDEDYTIKHLQADVEAETNALFNVYEDGLHIASMVLRVDSLASGKDLVVVAAGGYGKGFSLYKQITPFCENLAASLGCKRLRGHCTQKSIGRLMERAGWLPYEFVYERKVLTDGQ